jgi:anti-sigma B factor antagonist
MSDIRTRPAGDHQQPGTVEVEHHAPGLAVVSLRGEHDLSTSPELRRALEQAAAHSTVLVDFCECSFIDSSVIQALVRTARALHAGGEQLVLVIPPEQKQVARVAQMTQLAEIFPIHTSRHAALVSIQGEE